MSDKLYMEQIGKIPLLTAEEELRLAAAYAAGDQDALRQMVSANLRLVVHVAKGYADSGVPLMDLVQAGSIGVIEAAKRFDPALGYRFSTYATKLIRAEVLHCLEENGSMIPLPGRLASKLRKIEKARSSMQQPTVEDIAKACDMEITEVTQTLELAREVCFMDDDSTSRYVQSLEAAPQEEFMLRQLRDVLEGLLSQLTERQNQVLRLRFGLVDGHSYTHEEIGNKLGISKQRVREITNEGVARLQRISAGLGLEDFLEL